jgi:hypothetical protein
MIVLDLFFVFFIRCLAALLECRHRVIQKVELS